MKKGYLHRVWLASAMAFLFTALSVNAASSTVTSTGDAGGSCPGADCTLRQAIAAAFSGDTITFSLPANSTITLTSGELLINKSLTITGPGANGLSVARGSGAAGFRIFDVASGVTVTISGLTVSNGILNGSANNHEGGGIFNAGTLTVANSIISGNSATGLPNNAGGGISNTGTLTISASIISGNTANNNASGGGIHNTGTLTITGSTISGNSANNSTPGGGGIRNEGTATISNSTISGNTVINSSAGKGAGIYNVTGALTLTNCAVSANNADTGFGGGIGNDSTTAVTVVNSTISGNAATVGAGFYNSGTGTAKADFRNTTIAGNTAKSAGGGIESVGSTLTIKNTIVATNSVNTGSGPDVAGAIVSQGYNFIGNNVNVTFTGGTTSTDQIGTPANPKNPMLGALHDNGGPTQTQALLSGSTAIDAGNASGSSTDQRGLARPVDDPGIGNASGGDGSDIGAYEVQADLLPGCININTVVNNTGDNGAGSLRDVIATVCAGSTITFAPNVRGAITLASSELVVARSLRIVGPGASLLSVQRSIASNTSPFFRIFNLSSASNNVFISGLTVTGGSVPGGIGGGIVSRGGLILDGMVIANNAAIGGNGGGIFLGGTTVITNTTISGNTISSNSAGGSGGGIFNFGATVAITNSTISGNSAVGPGGITDHGGALYSNVGSVTFTNSTLSANSSDNGGALLAENGGMLTAQNTIIALNNSASGPDVKGPITSQGFNIFGSSAGAAISPARFTDQIGVTAAQLNLGPLQDNGGPGPTHALLPGSVAIDKGNASGSSNDQRGFPRLIDFSGIANATDGDGSDIGAFEVQPATTLANISTRLRIETGDNVLFAGFIITGTQPKKIIVLGTGPSLTALGVPGALANPVLELYQGNTLIDSSDNWVDSPNKQAIIDSGVAPTNDFESAIMATLPANNSQYTAIVRGAGGGTGAGEHIHARPGADRRQHPDRGNDCARPGIAESHRARDRTFSHGQWQTARSDPGVARWKWRAPRFERQLGGLPKQASYHR
jgi:CSLREA domain-containing protein